MTSGRGEKGVFYGDQCIFMAPPARFVPQLMEHLFNWMKEAHSSVHPLILSSVFIMNLSLSIHFLTVMAEWQDCGILLFFLNGNRSLNTFRLRAKLRIFKTNIMMQLPSVI